MESFFIRSAEKSDIAALDAALACLSRDLGDPHRAEIDVLERALFGVPQLSWACVADAVDGIAGVVLFAPVFSTVRGGAGVYVSDLWVGGAERGRGLGAALLRSAAETARNLWDAGFIRLSVHDDNERARDFYENLGFAPAGAETVMLATVEDFQRLRRTR